MKNIFNEKLAVLSTSAILMTSGIGAGMAVSRAVLTPDNNPHTLAQMRAAKADMQDLIDGRLPADGVLSQDPLRAQAYQDLQIKLASASEKQNATEAALLSENISEQDFSKLVKGYKGSSYRQECILAVAFSNMAAMDDATDTERAADVAACMADAAAKVQKVADLGGGLGGLALGGMFAVPLWRRRRPS